MEKSEKQLAKQKSLYESILMSKARLFMLLETLNLADDTDLDKRLKNLNEELTIFKTLNPTAENIVVVIYDILRPKIENHLDVEIKAGIKVFKKH